MEILSRSLSGHLILQGMVGGAHPTCTVCPVGRFSLLRRWRFQRLVRNAHPTDVNASFAIRLMGNAQLVHTLVNCLARL